MRNVRLYLVTAALTTTTAAALLLACGDDVDVSTDVDGGVPEAGVDATADADTGAPPADAGVDAPVIPVLDYAGLVADGLCSSLTRCCFGDANLADGGAVDGGDGTTRHYDAAQCRTLYRSLGFEYSNIGADQADAGVVVDPVKAQACLDQVKALPCDLPGDKLEEVRASCFEAVVGQRKIGEPCHGSVECAKGAFCDVSGSDGGPLGTCAALRGQGQSCGVVNTGNISTDSESAEEACSWRGGGDTNLRCASYEADGGAYIQDYAQWTCQPTVALGEICNTTVSCEKGICDIDQNYICASPVNYFGRICQAFTKP